MAFAVTGGIATVFPADEPRPVDRRLVWLSHAAVAAWSIWSIVACFDPGQTFVAKPQDLSIAAPLHAIVMYAIVAGDEAAAEKASDALMDYVDAFTKATVNV